jgi:cytochrome c2
MHLRNRSIAIFSAVILASVIAAACSDDDNPPAGSAGGSGSAGRTGAGGVAGRGGSAGSNSSGDAGIGGEAGESAGGAAEAGSGGEAELPGSSGPSDKSATTNSFVHPVGKAANGKDVFRFETFGNEGFWTNVLQLPQGIISAKLTPLDALKAGLSVDIESVPTAMQKVIAAELKTDLSAANAPALNDYKTTVALIEANAVIGLSARNVQLPLNGTIDIDATDVYAGESVGVSCAFCHSITDGSVFSLPKGGSIGKRVDGPANHFLNVGASLALGLGSRAIYPTLALALAANKNGSLSRAGGGMNLISKAGTEVEVDAYLTNPALYPIGMFDDAPDGNGAPMHIPPFFRADLAAPWGSEGSIEMLQNFGNLVYTALLDPTDLTTVGGRKFLMDRGGAAGIEIADNYEAILADMGIAKGGKNGYPFVGRADRVDVALGLTAGAKVEASPIGMQVDPAKNKDLNAYLNSLPSPPGDKSDMAASARGRIVFRAQCTSCHNDDQSKFVPQNVVPFNTTVDFFSNAPTRPTLWPGYSAPLNLADRPGLAPVRNSDGTLDDKMVIVDASNRTPPQPRGDSLPLLMDLARKPTFLHDDSVASLDSLLDPARSATAPHPFYVAKAADRADLVQFLRSLDDQPLP